MSTITNNNDAGDIDIDTDIEKMQSSINALLGAITYYNWIEENFSILIKTNFCQQLRPGSVS